MSWTEILLMVWFERRRRRVFNSLYSTRYNDARWAPPSPVRKTPYRRIAGWRDGAIGRRIGEDFKGPTGHGVKPRRATRMPALRRRTGIPSDHQLVEPGATEYRHQLMDLTGNRLSPVLLLPPMLPPNCHRMMGESSIQSVRWFSR